MSVQFRRWCGLLWALLLLKSTDALHTLRPSDDGYAEAIAVTNAFCHVRCPRVVLQPTNPFELAEWMRTSNEPFTVKGGGHSYGCQSVAADDGVLIDTSRLKARQLHTMEDGSVQLELGAGWLFADVLPWLHDQGFIMPHGECSTVGVAGWLLNNGNHPELLNYQRWYGERPFLRRITAVTTQGSVLAIDENGDFEIVDRSPSEPQIVWGMRRLFTRTSKVFDAVTSLFDLPSLRETLFERLGANWMVATSFRIEVLRRPEPFFGHVLFDFQSVVTDPAALEGLMRIDDLEPNVECGISVLTNAVPNEEISVFLKCVEALLDISKLNFAPCLVVLKILLGGKFVIKFLT